jgi:ribosomal protein L32
MSIVTDFREIARRLKDPNNVAEKDAVCKECEDTGHICYSTGHMDPHFRICPKCGNPKERPCP